VEQLQPRLLQFEADGEGQPGSHHPRQDRKRQVKRADILVIGRKHPAPERAFPVNGGWGGDIHLFLRRNSARGAVPDEAGASVSLLTPTLCRNPTPYK
jgi:hypothetical protein